MRLALALAMTMTMVPLAAVSAQPVPSGWTRRERVMTGAPTAIACTASMAFARTWEGRVTALEDGASRVLGPASPTTAFGRELAVTRDGHVVMPVAEGIAIHDGSAWHTLPIAWPAGRPHVVADVIAFDDAHVYFASEGAIGARDSGTLGLRSVGTWRSIEGLAGTGPAALWAVGQGGTVMRWDGAHWARETTSTDAWLRGIAVQSTGEAWAWSEARIFRRDAHAWSTTSYGSPVGRVARVVVHGSTAFLVGDGGVARWTGAWTAEIGSVELGSYASVADACATDHTLEVVLTTGDQLTRAL
ncbi:MAG: hypothetical protein U0234_08345 [Sandaracinus sp.]